MTMADADNILRELLDEIVQKENWKDAELEIKAITSGGANYTSALYLVNVALGDRHVKLFAKVAIVGETLRVLMDATRLFYLEAVFYNSLSKTYEQLEIKHGLENQDRFVYPKFYGCNTKYGEETMIMENLVARGYGPYNRFQSVDWPHAAASVEVLAKFHALSFAFQKDNPEEFEVFCKDVRFQNNVPDDESNRNVWAQMIESSLAPVKEEDRAKVLKFLETSGDDVFTKYRLPMGTTVIAHGDFRPSNLLYKQEGDNIHAILVDYQTIHSGGPTADLVYFEALGTDAQFRAEHHDRLMDHYYSELTKALQRLQVDVTEVYPREVFDKELEETLPYALVIGVCVLPMVLVEAENAPRLDGDVDSLLIESTSLFAERIVGIVDDCVRWGAV